MPTEAEIKAALNAWLKTPKSIADIKTAMRAALTAAEEVRGQVSGDLRADLTEIIEYGRRSLFDHEIVDRIMRALARRGTGQAVPDGWVLVPKEPTEAMERAGNQALAPWIAPAMHSAGAYAAMLAAAPKPEDKP